MAAIRSDTGPPFASTGVVGLSRLAVWWIKLGIHPLRIQPARPDQNGRQERMHRTLNEWIRFHPVERVSSFPDAFADFMDDYNWERPHTALGHVPPGEVYHGSTRCDPGRAPEMEYPSSLNVRRVKPCGEFSWHGQHWYVSEALAGEPIGIEEWDDWDDEK